MKLASVRDVTYGTQIIFDTKWMGYILDFNYICVDKLCGDNINAQKLDTHHLDTFSPIKTKNMRMLKKPSGGRVKVSPQSLELIKSPEYG